MRGLVRITLAGKSDLAEIAAICALDRGIEIIAVVDPHATGNRFMGLPLVRRYEDLTSDPDAVVVTDLLNSRETCEAALARFGKDGVLIPELLRLRMFDRKAELA